MHRTSTSSQGIPKKLPRNSQETPKETPKKLTRNSQETFKNLLRSLPNEPNKLPSPRSSQKIKRSSQTNLEKLLISSSQASKEKLQRINRAWPSKPFVPNLVGWQCQLLCQPVQDFNSFSVIVYYNIKGQLISEGLLVVIITTKNPTKMF